MNKKAILFFAMLSCIVISNCKNTLNNEILINNENSSLISTISTQNKDIIPIEDPPPYKDTGSPEEYESLFPNYNSVIKTKFTYEFSIKDSSKVKKDLVSFEIQKIEGGQIYYEINGFNKDTNQTFPGDMQNIDMNDHIWGGTIPNIFLYYHPLASSSTFADIAEDSYYYCHTKDKCIEKTIVKTKAGEFESIPIFARNDKDGVWDIENKAKNYIRGDIVHSLYKSRTLYYVSKKVGLVKALVYQQNRKTNEIREFNIELVKMEK